MASHVLPLSFVAAHDNKTNDAITCSTWGFSKEVLAGIGWII
jgi:hypothetical protein